MTAAGAASGRIGPNAITQCMAALQQALGASGTADLMRRCGLLGHVLSPPTQMVDEGDVVALHRAMRAELGIPRARSLSRTAGTSTGDYLLAHRIPTPARWLLPRLPAALAARLLLKAISAHAWTFCGTGEFSYVLGSGARPLRVSIAGCATCRGEQADQPLCDFYAATFERLFSVLVHPRAQVSEVACSAMGAPACVFEIRW